MNHGALLHWSPYGANYFRNEVVYSYGSLLTTNCSNHIRASWCDDYQWPTMTLWNIQSYKAAKLTQGWL